jgi:glycosyltransferase involved in cell wall biosynthesis
MNALPQLARADVLFLNWRDPAHPQAGGAETYCFEIARRLAAAGVRVTLFTARHAGAAAQEDVCGVRILRSGDTYTVYAAAALHLLTHRHSYDAVVDFQNGIPFFSPLFTSRWTAGVCVIHHIHQKQFDVRFRFPLNSIGRLLEKQASRMVYRGWPIVAVSPSTREGMRRDLCFRNPVHIVPNGGPGLRPQAAPRSDVPSLVVVSRLVPQKRVDWLVRSVPRIAAQLPELRVDIAGDGPELPRLRELATELGVEGRVTFHGHVDEGRKRELLAQAWLAVVPSAAEGWGLTVIEANAVDTPALAYDVPGLRDAIHNGRNGWLLAPGEDLVSGVVTALDLLGERGARGRVAERCRSWAAGFSWDDSAERLAQVVLEECHRTHRHRHSRRGPSDLAVIAQFQVPGGAVAAEHAVTGSLRRSDRWVRRDDTFRLLLRGCDEVRASLALRRLGVTEATLALASHVDQLVPPGSAAP